MPCVAKTPTSSEPPPHRSPMTSQLTSPTQTQCSPSTAILPHHAISHLTPLPQSLLAEITNASKTSNPPTTDLHILALITKTRSKSADSVAEFRAAGREDLAEREAGQIAVLDSYASQVETVGEDEIVAVVKSVVDAGTNDMGGVMREVMKAFEGKPVVKGEVAAIVKKVLAK